MANKKVTTVVATDNTVLPVFYVDLKGDGTLYALQVASALTDSSGASITSTNPMQVNLAQNLAGEDFSKSATGRILTAIQDATNPAQVMGVSAAGQLNAGSQVGELTYTLPTLNAKFIDTGTLVPTGRIRAIWIVITTALTWVTSGTPTIQLYSSRTAFTAAGGAATQLGLGQTYISAAINALAGAATTWTLNNILRLSPNAISSSVGATNGVALAAGQAVLNDVDPFGIGIEFTFPSALTGGAMTVFMECSGT